MKRTGKNSEKGNHTTNRDNEKQNGKHKKLEKEKIGKRENKISKWTTTNKK